MQVKELKWKESDAEIAAMLPKKVPLVVSVELAANSTVANAIRRVIMCEFPTFALTFEERAFTKSNDFSLVDKLQTAIRCIPLLQLNAVADYPTFSLYAKNDGIEVRPVLSSEITANGNKREFFPQNIVIDILEPGKHIKIDKITIIRDYGYVNAAFSIAAHATSIPLDVTPYNAFTKTGTRTSVQNAQKHRITFTAFNNIEPARIFEITLQELIRRVNNVENALPSLQTLSKSDKSTEYALVLPDESDTISLLVVRCALELDDKPSLVITRATNHMKRETTIRLRTAGDPAEIIKNACKHAIKLLKALKF